MATLLLICGGARDLRELACTGLDREHRIVRYDYGTDALERLVAREPPASLSVGSPGEAIAEAVARGRDACVDGVVSTDDYPGSTLACIVARELGLPGVEPVADLTCQHKYLSRCAQRNAAPEAVPWFARLGDAAAGSALPGDLRFPVFVKPVKSFFSIGASRVDSVADLRAAIASNPAASACFLQPFDGLLRACGLGAVGAPLLVEAYLPGRQATLDGFACKGAVRTFGVVDSIMFRGTTSFERFEYPSSLPESVQRRMADIAARVMMAIGFDNGLFNIEFIHDPRTDALHIVEINPRMSSQFADLYEKVDGFNPYRAMVDLALGRTPAVRFRQGRYRVAASCVLRVFADRHVDAVPGAVDVARVHDEFPDARIEILATEGSRLSDAMQDGHSFRYGLVNLGADDRAEILSRFERCRQLLPFALRPPALPRAAAPPAFPLAAD